MRALSFIKSIVERTRDAQRQTLAELQALDASAAAGVHCAMPGGGPPTGKLRHRIESRECEGGTDLLFYSAKLDDAMADAADDPWLCFVIAAGVVAGVILSIWYPLGFAS